MNPPGKKPRNIAYNHQRNSETLNSVVALIVFMGDIVESGEGVRSPQSGVEYNPTHGRPMFLGWQAIVF